MITSMDKFSEATYEQVATMTHEEVVRRFKKVFGREMTPSERNSFFLPDQEAASLPKD
jgi:hypothetical protein